MKTKKILAKKFLNNRTLKTCIILFILISTTPLIAQNWMQLGGDIPGQEPDEKCGASVSTSQDGLTVAVSSPFSVDSNSYWAGSVRVFRYNGTDWTLKGNPLTGTTTDRGFGIEVCLSADGNRIAICASGGAQGEDAEVKIYEFNGSDWEQLGNSLFWNSITLYEGSVKLSSSGDALALGDIGNSTNGNDSGQVRIYTLTGNSWQQRGSAINGLEDDIAGDVLDLSDDANTIATNFGKSIQVYTWNGSDWTPKGNLFNTYDYDDVTLGMNGDMVVVSGAGINGNGGAQVFMWNGSSWIMQGALIEGPLGSGIGFSAALSNNNQVLALGGPGANSGLGEARTYMYNGTDWAQVGNTIVGETSLEYCGYSVSLNGAGNIITVGSPTYLYGNYGLPERARIFRNDEVLGIELPEDFIFESYPNPTRGSFIIKLGKTYPEVSITVYNKLGEIISEKQYHFTNSITQEITGAAGVYIVRVSTGIEGSKILRIIKQ